MKAYIHAQTNSNPLTNEYGLHLLYGYAEYKTYQYINPKVRKAAARVPFREWYKAEIKLDSIVPFSKAVFPTVFKHM